MASEPAKDWFDPRATVFLIWGVFILFFVCLPSRRYIVKFFGIDCGGGDDEDEEYRSPSNETDYESLSRNQRGEVDSLRACHILRKLTRFTAALKDDDMVRRASELQCQTIKEASVLNSSARALGDDQHSKPDPSDEAGKENAEGGCVEKLESNRSNEAGKENTGNGRVPGSCADSGCDNDSGEEGTSQYTHISVPRPGVAMNQNGSLSCSEEIKAKGVVQDACTKRDVPIFCAVCLGEYESKNRICWSSNPECTHVFHEDCILQWLISLGRTKSKRQRYSENPTEKQLLGFSPECPCCRQDFVSSSASLEENETTEALGEENV